MRPKTFPATTYSGNSRQRLQEIREGLKQPSKSSTPGLPGAPNSDPPLDAKGLGGKDASRQQQMRATPKFGPYQKALREIRYSLLPFANESGTSATAEVNRQMLQELVNAGCDQVGPGASTLEQLCGNFELFNTQSFSVSSADGHLLSKGLSRFSFLKLFLVVTLSFCPGFVCTCVEPRALCMLSISYPIFQFCS